MPISNHELKRKIAHIMVSSWWIFATVFFSYSHYLLITPIISYFIICICSKYSNKLTLNRKDNIKEYGVFCYFLGMLILLLLLSFCKRNLVLGTFFAIPLIFGDSVAAVFGKKFGKTHFILWFKSKTMIGSLSMFTSSLVFLSLYNYVSGIHFSYIDVLIIAIIATVVELISIKGVDNLTIPCVPAIIYLLIQGGINGYK